jgi:hypothetical protein
MKILLTFLILLFTLKSYPQADLDLILTFITDEDPQYNTWELHFGLDPTATNGIDPWLGEFGYPPDACGGWGWTSCIVFCIPPFSSNEDIGPRDYRYGILPYSGQILHKLDIGLGYSATQAEMFWDFPQSVSVHLEDLLGGLFFELDMQGSGSFIFTDSILIFNSFIMNVTYNNVVPVELTSFSSSVLQNEKAVQLNWTTATETNNSGFEIQKTSPFPSPYQGEGGEAGRGWEIIGFVPGFGTTTEPKSYSFTDENVTTGTYKYRLKQIDFDGSFEYSNEIEVEVDFTPKEFVLYQNYPNPFNPNTTIKFEIPNVETHRDASLQMVILKVYDLLGNEVATLVNEEKQPGVYEVEFDASLLASGLYLYKLQSGSFVQTMKMILTK